MNSDKLFAWGMTILLGTGVLAMYAGVFIGAATASVLWLCALPVPIGFTLVLLAIMYEEGLVGGSPKEWLRNKLEELVSREID